MIWALPTTFFGLLLLGLAVASGGRAARVHGVLEAHGGWVRWALRRNADPYRDNRFEREAFAVANPADGRPGRPGQLSAATGNEPPSPPPVPPQATRIRTARVIAMVADLMQLVFFPAFAGGWVSPLNDALDIVVALLMVRLVGWHLAFLPTLVAELVPGLDLIPTWTAAVWFASRHGARPPR